MPLGGQPTALSSAFKGLNRLLAPHMLGLGESPDTADAGAYTGISNLLGPRAGRSRALNVGQRIKGVIPMNINWARFRLIADETGTITPYAVVWPNEWGDGGGDYGSILTRDAQGNYVSDGGGFAQLSANTNPNSWKTPLGQLAPSTDVKVTVPGDNSNQTAFLYAKYSNFTPGRSKLVVTCKNLGPQTGNATVIYDGNGGGSYGGGSGNIVSGGNAVFTFTQTPTFNPVYISLVANYVVSTCQFEFLLAFTP